MKNRPEPWKAFDAALRDRVDDAARRAAVFGRVAARLDLHFVDEVDDQALAGEAVLQVGRLDAVDDVPVLAGARAVDREATELGLLVGAGGLRHERREVAATRQQVDLFRPDVGLPRVLLDVDERRFCGDRDRFLYAGERHRELEPLDLPEADRDVRELLRREARQRRAHFIRAGGQRWEPECTVHIGCRALHDTGSGLGFDGDARQYCARRVFDSALDGATLILGGDRPGQQQNCHECGKGACSHWYLILLK